MNSKYKTQDGCSFTFADLFAGIGGMRLAFEAVGGGCTVTSEIDEHARSTYYAQRWQRDLPGHISVDDVTDLAAMSARDIPSFDLLVAGFPCQPYSIAGLRQGLEDEKGRGQVFLSILKILKKVRPKAFLLENVKGMLSHDSGNTIRFMCDQLRHLGTKSTVYQVLAPRVLNSMTHAGIPQNRQRVFILGFLDQVDYSSFNWPGEVSLELGIHDLLDATNVSEKYFYSAQKYECFAEIERVVVREDTAYQWRRKYVRENKSGVCPALTANMGSGGHNVPLVKVGGRIRKLTPLECARLQGFPANFTLPDDLADAHLYHQFGNSVTVPLIERLASQIANVLVKK